MTNIVKNNSTGYGYKYASLADIASQGYEIPKMKTGTDGEKEYVYYFDPELKDWIRGAGVIVPENKGMNAAQLYGSALTYARRYTALLALQLACDDDKAIEDTDAEGNQKTPRKASDKQIEYLAKLYSRADIEAIMAHYKVEKLEDLDASIVSQYIENAKKRNEERISNR